MAQFTTHGRLKLLFNGESVSSRLDRKDPFHYKCRSVQTHKRRIRYIGSAAGIYHASSSSLRSRTSRCDAEARPIAGNEVVHDECDDDDDNDEDEDEDDDDDDVFEEDDGLSCFRGLVLDISYRSLLSLNMFFLYCCYIEHSTAYRGKRDFSPPFHGGKVVELGEFKWGFCS